jgi:polyisoprenoid-binding protein YceI
MISRLRPYFLVLACSSVATTASGSHYPVDPAPALVLDPRGASAGDYQLEIAHSSVTARLSHMGLSFYTIRFNDLSGHYSYDPTHPRASNIHIVINPASIDTGNAKFNAMIATAYFETAKYPAITFNSNVIHVVGNRGTVAGVLEMHGVRKPIVLNVIYHGFNGAEKPERMGFSATASLKRSDFGVDPYVPAEGDAVTIMIETEFRKV